MNTRLLSIGLAWIGIFLLSSCALLKPDLGVDVCEDDCRVDINLPNEPRDLHVQRGAQVNFHVRRPEGESGHTVLSFEEAAFVMQGESRRTVLSSEEAASLRQGESGRTVLSSEDRVALRDEKTALYTLELGSGNNLFTASSEDVCAPPDGCRYVVIDMEHPDRPSIISTPQVIFY